ncbi:hypothetical protein [Sphingobacterium thalpophilum]|uniref:hypothetical protein n=1 Tax=Sphingobacterium thalpophilum TaxID=259 RepID=UPI003D99A3AD
MKKSEHNYTINSRARDAEQCLNVLVGIPSTWQPVFSKLLLLRSCWQSSRCALRWTVKKTSSGRIYPKLLASSNATRMLPTVVAIDSSRNGEQVQGRMKFRENCSRYSANLCDLAKSNLLPTPTTGSNRNSRNAIQKIGTSHSNHGVSAGLAQAVELSMGMLPKELKSWSQVPYMFRLLPTPTTRDYKGGRHPDSLAFAGRSATNSLNDAINGISGKCCKLNPLFVAEMMGFSIKWILAPFQKINNKTRSL